MYSPMIEEFNFEQNLNERSFTYNGLNYFFSRGKIYQKFDNAGTDVKEPKEEGSYHLSKNDETHKWEININSENSTLNGMMTLEIVFKPLKVQLDDCAVLSNHAG